MFDAGQNKKHMDYSAVWAEKGKTGVTEMGIYATERNDDTHYTEKGANYLADFVSREMKAIGLPVGVYVK